MNTITVQHDVILATDECLTCGVIFGMPQGLMEKRMKDHQLFYCPNGHSQYFCGETHEQKLRKELETERRRSAQAQFELLAAEKKVKQLEKRAKNGICPCCHRQFSSVADHMKSVHPELFEQTENVRVEIVQRKPVKKGLVSMNGISSEVMARALAKKNNSSIVYWDKSRRRAYVGAESEKE